MKRFSIKNIHEWVHTKSRKPLILQGQRQVGKTYFVTQEVSSLLENNGKVITVDFFADKNFKEIFKTQSTPKQIINKLEIHLNLKIDLNNDLLFLDEIQESSEAIQSLKYFFEQLPQLKIICAGSYLGIISNESSFPIGKVEFASLGPLSFEEFLLASSQEIYDVYKNINLFEIDPIDPYFHKKFLEYFNIYLAIGGMPEVVDCYFKTLSFGLNKAVTEARKIQKQILIGYQSDFSKYAGMINASHILHVYEAVSSQLAKTFDESAKKFTFSNVIPKNKSFNKIQGPLTWLEKSRLVIKSYICNKSAIPLKAYTKENFFKLYYSDIGLLQCALEIPISKALSFELAEYKGFIAENFIATQLFLKTFTPLYSWSEGESEVEFIVYHDDKILPIEVKSSANYLRAKSLDSYIKRYSPDISIKLAPVNRGFNKEKKILSIPIYLINRL